MLSRMLNNRTLVLIGSLLSTSNAYANNSSGTILFPQEGETKPGNLLLVVSQATDPEGVQRVDMRFANSNSTINICNNNCNTALRRPVVGINPLDFAQQRGALQLELVVTDTAGTEQVVDSVNFNWQPPAVNNVAATRQPGNINVTWSAVPNASRYNVYIASEDGITPANIGAKADSQVFRSVSATSQQVAGFADDQGTFVLVTAVDRSGESAFSEELRVPALNNEPPEAEDDAFETDEDSTLEANVLDNDIDPEDDELTVNLLTSTANGLLTLQQDGSFSYSPNANFNGSDSFSYEVLDDANGSAEAQVTITIRPVNDAPLATDEQYQLAEDTALTISAAQGVLSNDSDIDGDALTASLLSPASSGTVNVNQDGSFSYIPNANFFGNDSFTYQVADSSNATATATVSLSVTSINDSPQANDDSYQTAEDQVLSGQSVLANDVDADGIQDLTVTLLTNVSNGALTLNSDGSFTYRPVEEFSGTDSFTYQITDSAGETSQATVTIVVTNVNDAPVASDDSYSLQEDQTLNVSAQQGVLANDVDPDSEQSSLTAVISSGPSLGSVSLASDGSFSYTPNDNAFGIDSFVYTLTDDEGASDTATVTLTIEQTADQPIAENDQASTALNQAVTINVLANDTDPDGGSLTVTAVSASAGSVTTNGSTVTYTPDNNFFGIATVNYTISNSANLTASAQITINVASGIPIAANDDQLVTNEDVPATVNVLSNDTGTGILTVTSATANQGSVSIGGGTLTYTPAANFNGSDTISYSITDSTQSTASAQVSVTVNAINDTPVANNDSISTDINTSVVINVLANDSDGDGDTLTISSATANSGTVVIQNQQLNYTPASGFSGQDIINYSISDGNGGTASATVTVTVSSSQLVANNDTVTTAEDTSVNINMLANDTGDSGLRVTDASGGGSGSIITPEDDNTITYTPPLNFSGSTTLNYFITDDSGATDSATVTITVTPVNDAPTASPDVYTLTSGQSVTIPATEGVLRNDSDIESDSFTASLLLGPTYDTSFVFNPDGSFTYVHNGSNNLVDGFIYRPRDSIEGTPVNVVLNIAKANEPATMCNIPPLTATSGRAFSFDLEANNPDNDNLTYNATDLPSWLTLSGNTLSGTPTDSDIGVTKNIELTVTDGINIHPVSNIQLTVVNDFGSSNVVDFDFGSISGDSRVFDMTLDRFGKIIAVGSVNDSGDTIAVARFNPDGSMDTSFSGDGIYTLDLSYSFDERATAVVVDQNNNIFVSAYGSEDSSNLDNDFYLLKLKSDGTLDTSFSGDGILDIEIQSDKKDEATDLVLHSDGDITLVGHTETNSGDFDVAMVHVSPDGTIDTSFGTSGKLIFNQANNQHAYAALLDGQGYIYVVGKYNNGSDDDLLFLRTTEERLDNTFNNGSGNPYNYNVANDQVANDVIFDNKGNLLVAGADNGDFAVYSFELDSNQVPSLNTSAFTGGKRIQNIAGTDVVNKIISDRQGAFYAVGMADSAANNQAVMKLNEDGTLDTGFDGDGIYTESTASGNSFSVASAILSASGQLITAGPNSLTTRLRYHLVNSNTDFSCNYTGISTNTVKTVDELVSASTAPNYQMFFAGKSLNPADSQTDFVAFKTTPFGTPDINFAENGILRHDSGSVTKSLTLTHVLADSNNSPYLVGYAGTDDLYIAKYTNDGQLDTNFNSTGINNFGSGDVSLITRKALLDSSNNLYLMGTNISNRATVVKITPSGGSDIGFANGSDIEYGDTDFTANDMAILSDGSIYLVGSYSSVTAEAGVTAGATVTSESVSPTAQAAVATQLAIVKYDNLGQLDTSFGSGGLLQFATSYNSNGVSVTTNGSYLYVLTEKNIGEAQIRKINSNGNLVSSFGNSGVLDLTSYQTYAGANIQYQAASGKLLAQVHNSSSQNVLLNLSANKGNFTPQFINGGIAPYTHNLVNWEAVNGIIQADSGRFVIFGTEDNDMAMSFMEFDGHIINGQSEILIDAGFGYSANSIALDPQSKILIAGSSYNTSNNTQDFSYAKFKFDGSGDTGLTGSSPVQITPDAGGHEESYRSILVLPTSEVQVTGQSFSASTPNDNNIVGFRTLMDSVTADSTYAGGGFDLDLASISDDKINDQIRLSDGSIIMVGGVNNQGMLLKLKADGTLDSSFGSGGLQQLTLGGSTVLNGVTIDAAGKIVAVGETISSGNSSVLMVRVDATSAAYDTSFDADGIATLDLSSNDKFTDVAVTPSGNYVAVGTSDDQTFIAQYKPDGTLYTTFNGTGYLTNDLGDNDIAAAVMIDNYGAILVATQTSESAILLRYDDIGTNILLTEYYPRGTFTKINDLTLDHQGNAYVTGQMQFEQLWEFFVIKFNAVTSPL